MLRASLRFLADAEKWQMTIGLCDLLSVLGVLIGIIGLYAAYVQSKKVKTAQRAVREYQDQLFRQRASQTFLEISPVALALLGQIRVKDWENCSKLAIELAAGLMTAEGFCGSLLQEDEKKDLEIAAAAIKYIVERLPMKNTDVLPDPEIQQMSTQGYAVLGAVSQVSGRLKSIST